MKQREPERKCQSRARGRGFGSFAAAAGLCVAAAALGPAARALGAPVPAAADPAIVLAAALGALAVLARRRDPPPRPALDAHATDEPTTDEPAAVDTMTDRLRETIEMIPEGIALFDPEERYVLWNQRYLDIHPGRADLVAVGRPLAEVLRVSVERGLYADAVGRVEEWLAERAARRRAGTEEAEFPLSGGRWIRIQDRMTPSGHRARLLTDITAVRNREASLRLLFEANPLPMWVYDRETLRFLAVNAAAIAHYGYDRDHFLAMTIADIRPMEDLPRLSETLARPRDPLTLSPAPWRHRTADGRLIAVDIASHALDFEGRHAVLVVAIDRTAQRAAEAELVQARDAAEAASRVKSDFLATMSHELRTPLNAIIGFSEIIESELMGPVGVDAYRRYAGDIVRSGRHLLAVVNQILDLSKAESGTFSLDLDDAELGEIIDDSLRMIGDLARRGEITVRRGPVPALTLRTDRAKLRQILLNLLSNAVKFTPPGGTVTVRAERTDARSIAIMVEDSGIGIAAKDIALALEPFGQVDSSLARRYQGTGLGLPLARRLSEWLGGRLELQSAVGVGTTVTIRLPGDAGAAGTEIPGNLVGDDGFEPPTLSV